MFRKSCLLFLLLLFASCSSYRSEFRRSVATSAGIYGDPTGPWVGDWQSLSGHRGPLWCIINPGEKGEYEFWYRAGWARVIYGNFRHVAAAEQEGEGLYRVKGDSDLGKLAGVYTLDATIGREKFDALYTSTKGDRGRMTLRRPGVRPD